MKAAYADPPYLGQARKHYGAAAREVDHALLIAHLETFDAWALSCSSPSLRTILPMCPDSVRVMAWVKPFASFKKGVNPAYAWEPVLVRAPSPIEVVPIPVEQVLSGECVLYSDIEAWNSAAARRLRQQQKSEEGKSA